LRVDRIEAIPVSLPIEAFSDLYGYYDRLDYVVAKIHTDKGLTGLGEASPVHVGFYGETQDSIISTVEKCIGPLVLGEDPLNIEKIESRLDRGVAGNSCAKAAVDVALHDVAAKALGVPVHALLGGLFREKAPVGFELGITKPEDVGKKVLRFLEMHVKSIKLHVGTTPKEDVEAIRALHDAVGDSAVIRADANGAYSTAQAIDVIKKVEGCELEYFEQPVSRWNIDGLRMIKRSVHTPIAVDETVWTPEDAMQICKKDAADVINIKIPRVGGLSKAKKIADIAAASFLKCHVGSETEFGVGMAAKAQLAVSLSNASCAAAGEFTEKLQLKDNIVKDPVIWQDGYLRPTDKPGLGIDLDEEKMKIYGRRYRA
jgi:muconate cycloisomerase